MTYGKMFTIIAYVAIGATVLERYIQIMLNDVVAHVMKVLAQ